MREEEPTRIRVPAREGVAIELRGGSRVSIVDLAGHQGADCVAVTRTGAVTCTRTTRARNRRLFPKLGQSIYADDTEAMLTLLEDSSPGPHGLLVPPCDPIMYRLRGAGCAHPSCHDNFHRALLRKGISLGRTPPSICLFQNMVVGPAGAIAIGINTSKPGDRVTFRTERELVFVVSACPNDVFKRSPLQPTDLEIVIDPVTAV
ncbi:urea carboxylase-associated family protein [Bradyrhizobium sp. AZCC 2230]|uniref:urea carboxylase-associated family protein n=1 Tax=Bradyrhizobium sp. AZCC 2230 TaxID=3117021 RepID=UPI002FF2D2CF